MDIVGEYLTGNQSLTLDNGNLFCDILQFTDIAVPRVVHQVLLAILGKTQQRNMVLLRDIGSKLAEEKNDVILAFPQRRNMYRNLIQTIIEVFTIMALAYSRQQIDIGGCNHTDIYFA